jgi:hypothetical protein
MQNTELAKKILHELELIWDSPVGELEHDGDAIRRLSDFLDAEGVDIDADEDADQLCEKDDCPCPDCVNHDEDC